MRSCLEIVSMEERHEELARNVEAGRNYNPDNPYDAEHPDARNIDVGDVKHGKGTGSSGHGDWRPSCSGQIGIIDYSNFDTDLSFNAGNLADNDARTKALVKSLYNKDKIYEESLIDRSMNIAEGQYVTY